MKRLSLLVLMITLVAGSVACADLVPQPTPLPSSTPTSRPQPTATRAPTPTPLPVPARVPLAEEQIAFCSDRSERWHWQIYRMNGDGGDVRRLTQTSRSTGAHSTRSPNPIFDGFAWSHDGTRIAYYSDDLETVAFMDSQGADLGHVADGVLTEPLYYPAWSPDGARVVGLSYNALYWAYADGTGITRLTSDTWDMNRLHPRWSPNGKRIAFRLDCETTGIGIVQADGKGLTIVSDKTTDKLDRDPENLPCILGNSDEWGGAPTWHPAGTDVVFSAYGGKGWQLFRVDDTGDNLYQLTTGDRMALRPEYSPDGSQIVFVCGGDICVMNADGSERTRLTDVDDSWNWFPTWSPDGTRIAFVSNRDGNPEIYVMDADGSNQTNVTNHPADDYYPFWRPRK